MNRILLKNMLLATSQLNIYRTTQDKKKKGKVIGAWVGMTIIYIMIIVYSFLSCIGFGEIGLIDIVPLACAMSISGLAFIFTIFRTNGYLFNFKEYDMIMSLPFGEMEVVASRFMYMYMKCLPWYLSVSLSMMVGYIVYAKFSLVGVCAWILLTLFVPLIPMVVATFLGFCITKITSRFKKRNILTTVLTFVVVIGSFGLNYVTNRFFSDGGMARETLENIYAANEKVGQVYIPAKWFADAINDGNIGGGLLLIGSSSVLFALVLYIIGKSYRKINSLLKSHGASGNYKMSKQKTRSVVQTIAYKEFKRMMGSSNYLVNATVGELLSVALGIAAWVIGFDGIIKFVTNGAPVTTQMVAPAIPYIVYFLIGMVATTACSPSLEGKNYWIIQSLPIDKKVLYKGKMLFNMYLTVPFMTFAILSLCITGHVNVWNTVLDVILGIALCAFSTTWGCVCGVRHMRLDWENEIEVIKQGAAIVIYLFPNMIVTMIMVVAMVLLGMVVNHLIITATCIVVVSLLSALCYWGVMKLAEE